MGLMDVSAPDRRQLLHGLLALAGSALLLPTSPASAAQASKDAAPDFALDDLDGHSHTLSSYRGKVVLLNFWASWCPPCRQEMPSIERLYQSKRKQAFVVLGINQGETAQTAFASLGLFTPMPTFPILLDSQNQVAKAYGVQGLPSSYVVSRTGKVLARAEGVRDFSSTAMLKYIDDLLL
jgi:thiol-disulfide isomerase/thioredoxin